MATHAARTGILAPDGNHLLIRRSSPVPPVRGASIERAAGRETASREPPHSISTITTPKSYFSPSLFAQAILALKLDSP